ncbi:16S rRNA (cytidine(1402)-2'-O)-methyltransferase [Candidatus Blochmannia ocreatus (nom. nud.)]|uniref:Ribosomal RNA small subunit methyltransferase I n=1 Tax=Candidatus Blochmannia ocreatus (nom. nud.) TaxID=251538 RepID=A0ABY4SXZ5_9ENTR|nr:16S rRNA (cytidine(1402)-2'-O)-methyltransferase [Candidatus Blochmannia ocreatus]URJ25143.1 16S rRNA (cytidine(1402)-2'-O)-methyltransferase [Candidatus Blochmannia ocreatus]
MSILYIVPTPIGNLQDITFRALSVLKKVDYIVAEDTRRVRVLLEFYSIKASLYSFQQYTEHKKTPVLVDKLKSGFSLALVADAGTPLISDPGYFLVKTCKALNIKVIPLPGPCAAITALCGSGLPTDRFCFEGFLPRKHSVRINRLQDLLEEPRTLIFYDVKHRIIETLQDMISVFGTERHVVLARELTKVWESIYGAPIGTLLSWIQRDTSKIRGEIVLIVSGNCLNSNVLSPKISYIMEILIKELPLKKVAILMKIMYGTKRNVIYKQYLNKKFNKVKK